MFKYTTLLTIAGSDSIGGAGIQADIKTATSLGVYAMSVVTSVTAQNSSGVAGAEAVSPEMLRLQLKTVLQDIKPDAVKIGMIPTPHHAEIIADCIEKYDIKNVVTDPVMKATSGMELCGADAVRVIRERLFPLSTLITPNIPEFKYLAEVNNLTAENREMICRDFIRQTRCEAILLKGGHSDSAEIADYLAITSRGKSECSFRVFTHPKINTVNTHGTGCTLSSAIASFLALGFAPADAVERGICYLQKAIAGGADYVFGASGNGTHGPVNHLIKY